MKTSVTISLFIFWAICTAILAVGLFYHQKNNLANCPPCALSASNATTGAPSEITLGMAELAKHSAASDCWLLINNKIYNVTGYIAAHPGGTSMIDRNCGQEATKAYDTKDSNQSHSAYAVGLLADYYIGDLDQKLGQAQVEESIQKTNALPPPVGVERENEYEDD